MKSIKLMLLGISFLLLGIWGAFIGVNNGGMMFSYIGMFSPLIGFIFIVAGLYSKN